jgi:HK97 family phage major capsid protein
LPTHDGLKTVASEPPLFSCLLATEPGEAQVTLAELQAKRDQLAGNIRTLADKFNANNKVWQGEDEQEWTRVNADYDENQKQLEAEVKAINDAAERATAINARIEALNCHKADDSLIGRDGGSIDRGPVNKARFSQDDLGDHNGYKGENLINALHGWLMMGSEHVVNISDKHRTAAKNIGMSLDSKLFVFNLNRDWQNAKSSAARFRNALSGEDGSAGGYTKDQTLINNLELAMLAYGGVMQVAEIIRTATGEPLRWPTADDTAQTGAQVGENASHAQSTDGTNDPTFGSVMWNAYTFTSRVVKVPNELMTDSVFNLATVLGQMLGERLGRIQNTKYTTGTGAGTAKGITVCAGSGVTTASSTAIAFDELIDLEHSLDPSRRSLPGVGYMFHDTTLKALRKLKDGEGRYLWQAGANTGAPDTLNTYPYTINQDMASSIASGAITALFGQLNQYKVRQVGQVILRRLDERYADTNQTGFLAIMRGDGNLLDAGDHPVKKMVQV